MLVLATKIDQLANQERKRALRDIERAIAEAFPAHATHVSIVPFSATHRIGIDEAMPSSPESASAGKRNVLSDYQGC